MEAEAWRVKTTPKKHKYKKDTKTEETSTKDNASACGTALLALLKELYRLMYGCPDTNVRKLLGELCDIICSLLQNCEMSLKKLWNCTIENIK